MKVILKRDLDDLGLEGAIVNVKEGYARNYLIPKGFALVADNRNIQLMEMQKKKIETNRIKAKEDAEKAAKDLEGIVITIAHKVGEEEKLFGSVTSMDIADEMEKKGISIDRKKILLEKPIKTLGEYDVPVKLHSQVTGSIKVMVIAGE
ncbi:MAG: 50S ribosomal protein L9 [Deltaproteobacteria bacterium]|nr:50S ribosomal protein L9 [Deltaproteobacteria bacterium]